MNTAATVNDASLAGADPQETALQPTTRLQRWRLVLGQPSEASCGGLGPKGSSIDEMDKALAALYERPTRTAASRAAAGGATPRPAWRAGWATSASTFPARSCRSCSATPWSA